MHIQVRSKPISGGGFHDGEPGDTAVSQEYHPGILLEMLAVLKDSGFNVRGAGGARVELGGEFAFWVGDPEKDEPDEETHIAQAKAAEAALHKAGFDAWTEDVEWMLLDDRPGALRERLGQIAEDGLLVEEILIGTPGRDTRGQIPVQLRLVRLNQANQAIQANRARPA